MSSTRSSERTPARPIAGYCATVRRCTGLHSCASRSAAGVSTPARHRDERFCIPAPGAATPAGSRAEWPPLRVGGPSKRACPAASGSATLTGPCLGLSRFFSCLFALFRRERFERDFRPATGKSPLPPLKVVWRSADRSGLYAGPSAWLSVAVFFRFGHERVFFASAPV